MDIVILYKAARLIIINTAHISLVRYVQNLAKSLQSGQKHQTWHICRMVRTLFFKIGVPGLSDLVSEKSNMAAMNTMLVC